MYDISGIFILHIVYVPLRVRSFECEIKTSTGNKTKQLLFMLKWQALVVSGQDNDKIDVMVQCREFFVNLDDLVTIMLKGLTFVCRLQKM